MRYYGNKNVTVQNTRVKSKSRTPFFVGIKKTTHIITDQVINRVYHYIVGSQFSFGKNLIENFTQN